MSDEEVKFFLVREKDHREDVTWEAKRVTYLSWENGRGKEPHRTPEVGRSLVLDFHVIKIGDEVEQPSYQWMTTPITEIIEEKTTPYFKILRFKTENSTYRLLKKLS